MLKKIASLICVTMLLLGSIHVPALSAGNDVAANPFESIDHSRDNVLTSMMDPQSNNQGDPSEIRTQKAQKAKENLASLQTRYIVKFKDDVSLQEIYDGIKDYEFTVIGDSSHRMFTIQTENIDAVKSAFGDKIQFAEEDTLIKSDSITTDEFVDEQWALPALNIPQAWATTKGSNTVYVAMIDSGWDTYHEDLNSADMCNGHDYILGGVCDWDSTGHGTATTGIVAATANNGIGISGVCWNVEVVPLLVTYTDGTMRVANTCAAIYDAADIGCDVINMSYGSTYPSNAEWAAIQYALSKGCILVAAAGNDGTADYEYPASYDGVVSAAAINNNLDVSAFSQKNDAVDVAAPGEGVLTTTDPFWSGGYLYGYADGTSFAAPYVTGIAALARSINDNINSYQFEKALSLTSTDKGAPGYDTAYGYGIVNARGVLDVLDIVSTGIYATNSMGIGIHNNGFSNSDVTVTTDNSVVTSASAAFNGAPIAWPADNRFTSEGGYAINVNRTDSSTGTFTFIIDKTPPVVTATDSAGAPVVNGATVYTATTVNVAEAYLQSISALRNGVPYAWPTGGMFTTGGTYSITAQDLAGNVTTFGFTLGTYNVHFDSLSGSALSDITATHGTTISTPAFPTRPGYSFTGWYKDPGCTTPWNFASDVVTDNTTLYAGWRAQAPSNYLRGISLSAGSLSRAFSAKMTGYTVNLGENDAAVTITPLKGYDGAVMMIDGKAVGAKTISLANGKTATVTVKVTWNKKTTTYKLTLKRAKSTNNLLSSLSATAGAWSAPFNPAVTSYTLTLPENVAKVSLSAVRASNLSVVTPAKGKYTLKNGQTVKATIKVKAQSGATRTYTVTIIRAKSNNANLALLKVSGATLTPKFSAGVMAYAVTLPAKTASVAITAKATDPLSKFTINGARKAALTVKLANGQSTTVTVTVVSQAGTSKSYTIAVSRQ